MARSRPRPQFLPLVLAIAKSEFMKLKSLRTDGIICSGGLGSRDQYKLPRGDYRTTGTPSLAGTTASVAYCFRSSRSSNYSAGERMNTWFSDYVAEVEEDFQIDEYDLTATPNDFNVITIYNFIESGAVRIPGFQRNYVWDIARASKLIESLILGLPVPQIFLYEQSRNSFLVIDGQQRLMSIYYFIKQRFPRKDKRVELRQVFDKEGQIPDSVLHDDAYFTNFRLRLTEHLPSRRNKFKGLNYSTLGDYKSQFDLRPVRNVIVKQTRPPGDDSSVFEMFNRLNTGGINLRPQEIRASMYHSDFYEMLHRINLLPSWRRFLQVTDPDLHMKDVEILLRGFAMLM